MKYIREYKDTDLFYASYGLFMHDLLRRFYSGELSKEQLQMEFLTKFQTEVKGYRPQASTLQGYIESGIQYFREFEPFPFHTLFVEDKTPFYIDDIPFVGVVDYVGELDGKIYLVDHKSRKLRPRSNRAKPTAKDRELDEMLKQLYLYSIPVAERTGRYPDYLCFNCFRTGQLIQEPFDDLAFDNAKTWVKDTVSQIQNAEEFEPNQNPFTCFWICGVSNKCIYDIEARSERM